MLTDFRLEVLLAVADSGSFTLAARKLGVSQPAVSQQVQSLEREVGDALFTRTKGAAILTEKGLLLAAYARKILHLYERANRSVIQGLPDEEPEVSLEQSQGEIRIRIRGLQGLEGPREPEALPLPSASAAPNDH